METILGRFGMSFSMICRACVVPRGRCYFALCWSSFESAFLLLFVCCSFVRKQWTRLAYSKNKFAFDVFRIWARRPRCENEVGYVAKTSSNLNFPGHQQLSNCRCFFVPAWAGKRGDQNYRVWWSLLAPFSTPKRCQNGPPNRQSWVCEAFWSPRSRRSSRFVLFVSLVSSRPLGRPVTASRPK